jgi:RHS repeat-associated protein
MLINGSQAVVAKYLYDAFGNTLSLAGPLANANLYRFSSKEAHQNSGLVYYLYRYYDPNLQRWPNKDPLGEPGFEVVRHYTTDVFRYIAFLLELGQFNLYEFVQNDPVLDYDALGLAGMGSPICLKMIAAMQAANAAYKANPTPANQAAWECAIDNALHYCQWPPTPPNNGINDLKKGCKWFFNRDQPDPNQFNTPSTCTGIRG